MSEYLEKVLRATGGHAAPAENLDEDKKEAPEGYHYMPDGTLMRDDAHDNEAAADDNPCWDGYVQVGMKEKNGKMVPNCVPADEAALAATAGSKPAPKKDQIKGSDKNSKGSASGGKNIKFSKKVEDSLKDKAAKHNEKHGKTASKKTSLKTLKAVYRRGAGAFSTSHRPDQNRNSWAMARVNAFLHLLRTGKPKNSKYVTDNDLLPATHPKSSKKNASSLTAAGLLVAKTVETMSSVEILPYEEYASDEHAIFSLAEYSDLGYEVIPAIRAAWLRGQRNGEEPFERAALLASALYDSPDADLLPVRSEI
jgi:hypothetical protein